MMKRVGWVTVLGLSMFAGVVAGATLSDFKEAAGKDGCESIPYDGVRSTCTDNSRDVDDWCKRSDRKISCNDLDPSGLAKQIENVKQKVADLERSRDELASKISDSKDDGERRDLEDKKKAAENEIYELEKKISEWESKLSDDRREIGNRIYNGERCLGYREKVAAAFSDAKSSAKSESDPEIKPYAEKLISKWEAGESGHAAAIRGFKEAVEKCKNMR